MDSVSGYGGARQPRSGGKILRPRRYAAASSRTPYDRPPPRPQNQPEQNPSWISRLVFSPARAIASGAGKFISSVVFSDSSSSSSSSSDADSASEIDADEENKAYSPEDETIDEMNMDLVNDQQRSLPRTSSKHVIEQLLMQETFGREECDRLMDIIKARVVDRPTVPAIEEGGYSGFPINGFSSDLSPPDMSTKAVMEARKWLEEKKSGSRSRYKPGLGSLLLDSSILPHPQVTENDAGSPVDMAKSYMQARPPWASPSADHVDFRSPSPVGMQLFKDDTPFYSSAGHLSSSKLKKGLRSSQSWNIQEELRKVRAKATEQMLRSVSSPKTVISSEPRHNINILASDLIKGNDKELFPPCANAVDAFLNADGRASSSYQAVQNMQDRNQIDASPNPATYSSELNQTAEANPFDEETRGLPTRSCVGDGSEEMLTGVKPSEDNSAPQSGTGAADNDGKDSDNIEPCSMTGGTIHVVLALGASPDSTGNLSIPQDVSETDHSPSKETGAHPVSNGFPSSAPSSPMAVDGQPEPKLPDEENNGVTSLQDEPKANRKGSQAVTETAADIPAGNGSMNENDSTSSASQNYSSSTREDEWLPDNQSLPNSGSSSPGTTTKVLAYSRRGRGRGRGGRGRGRGRGRASKQNTPNV